MFLSNKTDSEILEGLKLWIGKERTATSQVLHYLREVEERKLYLKNASSLREFCMKVHGFSRNEAQARVDAMRLLQSAPEIEKELDSGRLSLTVASKIQSAFRIEDARRLKGGERPLSIENQNEVLRDLIGASTREVDRKLATHFPQQPPPEQTKPISAEITRIAFNADNNMMNKLERLRAVHFHKTGGKWEGLFTILVDREIKRLDAPPRWGGKSAPQAQPRSEAHPPSAKQGKTRYVRKQTDQEIWANWEQGCMHILEDGSRCGSRENLQKDHIQEFAEGGCNVRENLRLVCGPHNRYRSDQYQKLRLEFMNTIESARREFEKVTVSL